MRFTARWSIGTEPPIHSSEARPFFIECQNPSTWIVAPPSSARWAGSDGDRRFPGELRLPGAACLVRAETRVEARGAARTETRYFTSSRAFGG